MKKAASKHYFKKELRPLRLEGRGEAHVPPQSITLRRNFDGARPPCGAAGGPASKHYFKKELRHTQDMVLAQLAGRLKALL